MFHFFGTPCRVGDALKKQESYQRGGGVSHVKDRLVQVRPEDLKGSPESDEALRQFSFGNLQSSQCGDCAFSIY